MQHTKNNTIHRHASRAICAGLLSIGLSACAMEQGNAEDQSGAAFDEAGNFTSAHEAPVLARVELSDGRSVEFFEPDPGFVFVRERGPIGAAPLTGTEETEGLSSAELYEHLSGKQAPEALTAALARTEIRLPADQVGLQKDAVANDTNAPLVEAAISGIGVSKQALSNGLTTPQFQAAYCPPNFPSEYFNWLNVTGYANLVRTDVYNFRSAVMSSRGTVHFVAKYRPWYTWKNLANLDIPAGWYERVERTYEQVQYDFDARATVTESDGDLYNMCTHF